MKLLAIALLAAATATSSDCDAPKGSPQADPYRAYPRRFRVIVQTQFGEAVREFDVAAPAGGLVSVKGSCVEVWHPSGGLGGSITYFAACGNVAVTAIPEEAK
jgi:hypothetical protein